MNMFIVASSAVMVMNCSISEGLLGGGVKVFCIIYLNVYAEFDSKTSYLMGGDY